MNIDVITVMFEEFKTLLLAISKKLDNLLSTKTESARQNAEPADTSRIEELIRTIPKPDISRLEYLFDKMIEVYQKTHGAIFQQCDRIFESITALEEKAATPLLPQRHIHSIEIKSSKVVVAIVALSVTLLVSLIGNIYQWSNNNALSANDIKYRYIKAFGEITPENLLKLETIFEYEPDKHKQSSIRQMVEEHEQRVKQRARELEQAQLKEVEAERLRKEAERIKHKK